MKSCLTKVTVIQVQVLMESKESANGIQRYNSCMDSIGTDPNDRRRIGAPRLSKINARNQIQGIYMEEQEHEDDD